MNYRLPYKYRRKERPHEWKRAFFFTFMARTEDFIEVHYSMKIQIFKFVSEKFRATDNKFHL